MSRYRSTRPDPRSKLTAPFLLRIAEIAEKRDEGRFPFTLPFMRRGGFALDFTNPVTILVGENGTGKSSLLEAIARKAGFNPRGGSRDNVYGGESDEVGLADAFHVAWLPKVTSGVFFRAESFFNFVTYVEGAYREDPFAPEQPWGARSLHERSHGEAFLSFFEARLGTGFPRSISSTSLNRRSRRSASSNSWRCWRSSARPAGCNTSSRRTRRC